MSPPRILRWPDPRLRARAAPVGTVDDGVRAVWDAMLAALEAMAGLGLAAPQIGVPRRLALVAGAGPGGAPLRLADPEILAAGPGRHRMTEASPCLPGIAAEVARPDPVTVRFLDEAGTPRTRVFRGLEASVVQHEIDHLDGRIFLDRLGEARRRLLLAAYMKRRSRG